MKNQMGFIVNEHDYYGQTHSDDSMGFYSFDDLENLATSVGDSVKKSAEENLTKLADEEIKKLLGTDKGKVTQKSDGTVIIQKEAAAPQTQYIQQPSQIPVWAWALIGTVGVGLLGLITYKALSK